MDDIFDELEEQRFERYSSRYMDYAGFLYNTQGDDACASFAEALSDAFEGKRSTVLVFEHHSERAQTLAEVLDECTFEERSWLKRHPDALGIRCEARLLGVAAESLAVDLEEADRGRLGELVIDALLTGLPPLKYRLGFD